MTTPLAFVPHIIGVDVGSRRLDCAWPDGSHGRFTNDAKGWAAIVERCVGGVLVMEATGVYFRGLALAATEAGVSVRVVNPWQVKAYATSRLARTKTDKVDAALIRDFGVRMLDDLPPWWPSPESLHRLQAIVRLGDGLLRHRIAASNRVHALRFSDPVVLEAARPLEVALKEQRTQLMSVALEFARKDELLGNWLDALVQLPGFGEQSALRFMAYAGDLRRFGSARRFASYTGLPPRFQQSGLSAEVGRMSRVGPRPLRSVLYWSAMSAVKGNSKLGERYRRMVAAGKPKKVVLVATANSLARAAWAVCVR